MFSERIFFDAAHPNVYLDVYTPTNPAPLTDAVLVIPGGAYRSVCDREGKNTALAFSREGVRAFVLNYSFGEEVKYPRQLLDAAGAVSFIRANADKYSVNPDRIFGLGYSAGGHLLGTLVTQREFAESELHLPAGALKLRGAIFSYPVITAYGKTHKGTFKNLLKKPLSEYTAEEKLLFSIEKHINADTPPAFIWHTSEDVSVPIYGSLKLCRAYVKAGHPTELHIYPYGPHGIALGTEESSNGHPEYVEPKAAGWFFEAIDWMRTLDKRG